MKLNLQQLRKQKRLSKNRLANLAGISTSYLVELEEGKYNPTADVICKLCKVLGCTPNDLIDCEIKE